MTTTNFILCENENTECPICMLEITGVVNRTMTECGHEFHTKCLLSNVAFNGFGCPYCRGEMVDEHVANHNRDDDDEDDDGEEEGDDDDDDDDENQSQNQQEENDVLRGFRFMLERITGESLTDEDDILEENEYQDELTNNLKPKPSVVLIAKKLVEQGVTMETFIKAVLLDHPEYNTGELNEEFYKINDDLYDKLRDIINNFSLEQENEVVVNQPEDHIDLEEPEPLGEKLDFYFLQKDFIDKCKQNTNTNVAFLDGMEWQCHYSVNNEMCY